MKKPAPDFATAVQIRPSDDQKNLSSLVSLPDDEFHRANILNSCFRCINQKNVPATWYTAYFFP
jgi:hypothetical protein